MIINSLQDLKDLLISEAIALSTWGINGAKSIENLWEEIVSGETVIQYPPLLRVTSVVSILVRKENDILIEAEQEFTDGRRRMRNHPPSEKMRAGENYMAAARRCLQEEMQRKDRDVKILELTHTESYVLMESPSYPGLKTKYMMHSVEALIKGLPDTDFFTSESAQNSKDPIKSHHWAWVAEERSQ